MTKNRAALKTISDNSLYLIISEEYCLGRSAHEIADRAIAGGVDIVQMREKNKSAQELIKLGEDLSALCKSKGALFIVNDDPILAKKVGSDGVHLGQEDMGRFPIALARDMVGRDKLIGISASSRGQLDKVNEEDVDYIAYGPIFPTKAKDHHIGTGDIEYVVKAARRQVFFIGGINLSNIDEILERGGRNIALIRGITEASDIESSARLFKERLVRR